MAWINPLTGQTYDNYSEFLDALAEAYLYWTIVQGKAAEKQRMVLSAIDEAIGKLDKTSGVVKVSGEHYDIKVTRKEYAKYPRERGATHPLEVLFNEYSEEMSELIRISIDEKGSKIVKLLGTTRNELSANLQDIATRISEVRVVAKGKPSIEITGGPTNG